MRISDWSSDVCSSDLTSDGDDSSTKGNNVPEPKSDGNDNSDNGSHTLPADLGSGMWKAFSQSIGCCDWEKFDVKPDECRIDPGKKPKKTRSGNVIVVLRCGPRRSAEHKSELQSLMRN